MTDAEWEAACWEGLRRDWEREQYEKADAEDRLMLDQLLGGDAVVPSSAEVEQRIRDLVALVDEDEEPFNVREEMLRLRAAHELLEHGHNIEAAAVLYGLQGRVARWAINGGGDDAAD